MADKEPAVAASTEKPQPEQRVWKVKDPATGKVTEFKVDIRAGGQRRPK